jgi:hypothetical protein
VRERVVSAGGLRAWRTRVSGRRLFRQGRLLILVLTVAILASTAITAVGLLVAATEQSAIRVSLGRIPSSQTRMTVNVEQSHVSLDKATSDASAAIHAVLGSTATAKASPRADSGIVPLATASDASSVAYVGELEGARQHVTIDAGMLPAASASGSGHSEVPIGIPQSAAAHFGLAVGSTLTYEGSGGSATLRVIGIYTVKDARSTYWAQDPLLGSGNSDHYLSPTGEQTTAVDAFGPLIVAPGTMDELGILADRVELDYSPRFSALTENSLEPLIQRLAAAPSTVPADTGDIADQVSYDGDSGVALTQIANALVVTRSTVVVVTLLLLLLSIAAIGQAARLFTDARAGDRDLMRARGGSPGQLVSLALIEAGFVGLITAAISAPLARLVYFLVATQPAMVAAHVPADSGLPASAWLTSIGLGALFILVLLFSLLGRTSSFVSAAQARARARRVSGLLRSGLDFGVVALAGVAFWQLTIYRSPVGATSTLSVDPVLVAAPALVLLAGALMAARLFPLLARLIDALGSRAHGVLFRLASWEIGRRSQRATSVVLLLTLALAVGAFAQTFLATWQQSQVDQADFAVGPPVRMPADPNAGGAARSQLAVGTTASPQPTIRRVADVSDATGSDSGTNAVVLGLTTASRSMLDVGQLAHEGGSVVASKLTSRVATPRGITLPGNPDGVSAVAQIGDPADPLPGVSADVRAIIADGSGLLSTVDLGDIPFDGAQHDISGQFASVSHGARRALPSMVVGVQVQVNLSNEALYVANPPVETTFLLGKLASTTSTRDGSSKTVMTSDSGLPAWNASTISGDDAPAAITRVPGWQVGVIVSVPPNLQQNPAIFAVTSWVPGQLVPAVLTSSLAHTLHATAGNSLQLNFADSSVTVMIVAITPLIPGAVDSSLLTAGAAAGGDAATDSVIVVDQTALGQAMAEGGSTGPLVDEWWVRVPPVAAAGYLVAHPPASGVRPGRSSVILAQQMQQDPLRVATQAALWLAIAAAAILAAIGFAVHSASSLASRRVELAQLRAIGLPRRLVTWLIALESLLLCALGAIFGVLIGLLVGLLTGPLIALSPNGTPAVPPVRVIVPWLELGLLVLIVVAVLCATVGAVAGGQRSANPANILREADNG